MITVTAFMWGSRSAPVSVSTVPFSSSPLSVWKKKVDDYLDALCKEIAYGAEVYRDRQLGSRIYWRRNAYDSGSGAARTGCLRRSGSILISARFGIYGRSRKTGQHYKGKTGSDPEASGHTDLHQSTDNEPENAGDHRPETYGGRDKRSISSGERAWL